MCIYTLLQRVKNSTKAYLKQIIKWTDKWSKIKVLAGPCSPWRLQGRRVPRFFQALVFSSLPCPSLACGCITLISASIVLYFLSSGSLFSLFYTDISHWITTHSNPGWPRLNLTNNICKTLFPNKVTFWVSGQTRILGRPYSTSILCVCVCVCIFLSIWPCSYVYAIIKTMSSFIK